MIYKIALVMLLEGVCVCVCVCVDSSPRQYKSSDCFLIIAIEEAMNHWSVAALSCDAEHDPVPYQVGRGKWQVLFHRFVST